MSPEVLPVMAQVTFDDPVLVAVTVTVPPASAAVTEMSGVLTLVRLSDDEEPESDAEAKSGVAGALGAVTSAGAPVVNVIVEVEVNAAVLLPARSVNAVPVYVMQYFVFAAKSAVGLMVAVLPENETWLSVPVMVANVAVVQLLPDLIVMDPLPPVTFSLNAMVGEAVVETSVAPDNGENEERVGPVVSIVMVRALEEVEALPAMSE